MRKRRIRKKYVAIDYEKLKRRKMKKERWRERMRNREIVNGTRKGEKYKWEEKKAPKCKKGTLK